MLHSFAWLGGGTRAAVWYLDLRLPSYRKSAVPGGLAYGTVTTAVTVVLGYSSVVCRRRPVLRLWRRPGLDGKGISD